MPKQVASAGRGAERLSVGTPFEQYPLSGPELIGTQILAPFSVAKRAAALSVVTRAGMLRKRDVRRQDGAAFSRDSYDVTELDYACLGYGHEQVVTKAQRETYRSDFDADEYARGMVQNILDRELEKRIAAEIFDGTTNWPSGTAALYTDVSTDWDDAAATIIADIEGAKEKVRDNCGLEANTLVVSSTHLKSFKLNTLILAVFKGGNVPVITDSVLMSYLADIFGLPKVLIGRAIESSTDEGQSFAASAVWSDDYAWIGVTANPGANIQTPCVGRTVGWDAFGGDQIEWQNYEEPQTKTTVWQGEHWTDEKVFDAYFGHLLKIDT